VLNRAVAWKLIDENLAKHGVPNPRRRCHEQRPFESWAQIRTVTDRLGPMFGPMVVFAAATGLRPSELFALERSDVDRAAGIVQVRRAFANGRVKQTKTRLSRRAVPLQAIALEALDQLPLTDDSPLLFYGRWTQVFVSHSRTRLVSRAPRSAAESLISPWRWRSVSPASAWACTKTITLQIGRIRGSGRRPSLYATRARRHRASLGSRRMVYHPRVVSLLVGAVAVRVVEPLGVKTSVLPANQVRPV
jgi:integrase